MAYEKTVWNTGDIVTAEKLNNLENGVASASGGGGGSSVLYADFDNLSGSMTEPLYKTAALTESYTYEELLALYNNNTDLVIKGTIGGVGTMVKPLGIFTPNMQGTDIIVIMTIHPQALSTYSTIAFGATNSPK